MDAVAADFESGEPATLENVWRALFSIQASVLKHQGGNGFGVPHEAAGTLCRQKQWWRRVK